MYESGTPKLPKMLKDFHKMFNNLQWRACETFCAFLIIFLAIFDLLLKYEIIWK